MAKRINKRTKTTKVKSLKTGLLRRMRDGTGEDNFDIRTLRKQAFLAKISANNRDSAVDRRAAARSAKGKAVLQNDKRGVHRAKELELENDALAEASERNAQHAIQGSKTLIRKAADRHHGIGPAIRYGIGKLIKVVKRTSAGHKQGYWVRKTA